MDARNLKTMIAQVEQDDFSEEDWRRILGQYASKYKSQFTKDQRVLLQGALLRSPVIDLVFLKNLVSLDKESWIELGNNPLALFWIEDRGSIGSETLLRAIWIGFFDFIGSSRFSQSNSQNEQRLNKIYTIIESPPWSDSFNGIQAWKSIRRNFGRETIVEEDISSTFKQISELINLSRYPCGTKALFMRRLIREICENFQIPMPPTVLDFLKDDPS